MPDAVNFCFSIEAVAFLGDLKANSNRDWFARNKPVYEEAIKGAAEAYCAVMCGELETLTGISHRSKIFRIYRDVRFSKDKSPYNAHLHISFFPESPKDAPGWFFGLEPDRLVLGAGVFGFEKATLEKYRDRVAGPDGEELATLLAKLQSVAITLDEPALKRVPPGYAADHPRADLLRRKGLAAWRDFGDTKIATSPNLIDDCLFAYSEFKPLVDWLAA